MLILDERVQKTEKAMDKIEQGRKDQGILHRKDAQLSALIRKMSQIAESVKRSGDIKKIARFNKQFFAATRELTLIRGKLGRSNRDDVVEIIKQWK
jgi:hypothetical protein